MKTKFLNTIAGFVTAGSLILSGTSYAAGSAAFSLSPASGTEDNNSTFSVGIYENGTSVNVVTANLSYDTSKLQFVSIDSSASAFTSDAGSSSTSISRYVPAGGTVSGSAEVAVVNFKAISDSGSAVVTVGTSGSHIASSGTDQWNGSSVSGSYTLDAAPAAPAAANSDTTTNTNTAAQSANATPAAATNAAPSTGTASSQATNNSVVKGANTKLKTLGIENTNAKINNHTARNTTIWIAIVVLLGSAAGIYFRKRPKAVPVTLNKRKTSS